MADSKMGTIVPNMGFKTQLSTPAKLFGQTRSALLALFYGHADQTFYLRQVIRTVDGGNGAVQRELKNLTDLNLVARSKQGNQVLYRANTQSPIFGELKSLITKTVGVHDTLCAALADLGSGVQVAFVYGSVARQQERAGSDVDLIVLGDARFSDVVAALGPAQKALGREINPAVYPVSEFRSRLSSDNHFLRTVMKEKKVFILGNEHELRKLAAK